MLTTIRIRRAHQSYRAAEKALKASGRRVRMLGKMFAERFTLADTLALQAAQEQQAADYQVWLDAGMLAAVAR